MKLQEFINKNINDVNKRMEDDQLAYFNGASQAIYEKAEANKEDLNVLMECKQASEKLTRDWNEFKKTCKPGGAVWLSDGSLSQLAKDIDNFIG